MQSISSVEEVIDSPIVFCEKGDRNTISAEASASATSFPVGFPLAFADTERISRKDVNAIGWMGSLINLFGCAGGIYGAEQGTLDGEGYPLGAIVLIPQGLVVRKIASMHGGNNLPPEYAFYVSDDSPWSVADGLVNPMKFDVT